MKLPMWDQPKGRNVFDDALAWETPEDFQEVGRNVDAEAKGKLLKDVTQNDEKV